MGFLAPLFLALGLGAAVPLLIHLLRRRTGVRIDFPAVRYLARAEQEHSRRLKLRNLLLMMLRVLAVACIALAAAQPVSGTLGRLVGATHAPTAVGIVLDGMKAVLEKREVGAHHRKVVPALVVRESTRSLG